jgi:hypothetical protein
VPEHESVVELAWAAGFFDGEGCTSYRKKSKPQWGAQVSITQFHPETLERFQSAVGGKVYGPYQRNDGKEFWQWRASSKADGFTALQKLWPYLGSLKREQAASLIPGLLQ